MSNIKLKNAPLKEAIFELFWNGPIDKSGFPIDNEYDLAQGRFDIEIRKNFPIYKRLIPANSSIKILGQPAHQFWKNQLNWPVVQLGPGIMTVNETEKGYIWDNFRKTIHDSIQILVKSYDVSPSFQRLSLRYIDSVDLPENINLLDFVNNSFKTKITNSFEAPGEIAGLNFNQIFTVFQNSKVHLNIQSAINNLNGKPAIVWITLIETNEISGIDDILKWIDKAHNICSDLFKQTLNKSFYETFNG